MEIFASYSGADFLLLYALLLATAILASLFIPAALRPEGRYGALTRMEDAAVLAGGGDRLTSAMISDLMAHEQLSSSENKRLTVRRRSDEESGARAALLRKLGDFDLKEASLALGHEASRIERDLIARGLLMDKGERWRLRLLSVLPFVILLIIGLYRWRAGEAIGAPTGLLVVLMVITAIAALVRLGKLDPRTRAGLAAIDQLRTKSSRLRTAPTAPEVGFAVALFGTGVLVGTPYEAVHAMRQPQGGDGGGFSSDSGSDGGGGCGGGCGGCGG